MKVFYSDTNRVTLPKGHIFPIEKYSRLGQELIRQNILLESELIAAPPANKEIITLVHTPEYYDAVKNGTLGPKEIRQIGIPWHPNTLIRSLIGIGGAISSAEEALSSGISGQLSGGTHHAFPDHGRGFCIFNDTAIVVRYLKTNKKIKKTAVLDLDAHQGNGTSFILGSDQDVFILDVHGAKSYPVRKIPSTLDVPLREGIEDEEYISILKGVLPRIVDFRPDIILFLAGVDNLHCDRFGKQSLTQEGIGRRDRMVLSMCKESDFPVAISMSGGYAEPIIEA
ncbi:MAG: histone deacetylase, partial [Anaerolineaceae bacterium]|nr:histone deacetylase [Anaerolineaceae bacterium]